MIEVSKKTLSSGWTDNVVTPPLPDIQMFRLDMPFDEMLLRPVTARDRSPIVIVFPHTHVLPRFDWTCVMDPSRIPRRQRACRRSRAGDTRTSRIRSRAARTGPVASLGAARSLVGSDIQLVELQIEIMVVLATSTLNGGSGYAWITARSVLERR